MLSPSIQSIRQQGEKHMSRSRRTSRSISTKSWAGRDVSKYPIARAVALPRPTPRVDLRLFEDRRTFHPDFIRPAFSLPRASSRLIVGKGILVGRPNTNVSRSDTVRSALRGSIPHQVGFEVPKDVVICLRRKRRREIMHALGKAGRGGIGRGRKRHTNHFSEISC